MSKHAENAAQRKNSHFGWKLINKYVNLLRIPAANIHAIVSIRIVRVLEQTHWKISGKNGAAEILGLNRSTLRARMRKLGIHQP